VFPLAIAPLRERRDDVLPLAMHLLAARCAPGGRIPALSADAAQMLLTYPWPGNVRELDNLVQRALILCNGAVLQPEHIRFELAPESPAEVIRLADAPGRSLDALARTLEDTERDVILTALRTEGGSRRAVAMRLGISPRTLRYKLARMRAAGIEVPAA
jgi:two-component system response regulator FlrC